MVSLPLMAAVQLPQVAQALVSSALSSGLLAKLAVAVSEERGLHATPLIATAAALPLPFRFLLSCSWLHCLPCSSNHVQIKV